MDTCNTGITHMESHKLLSSHLFMISIFFFLIFPSATSLSFNFTTFDRRNDNISIEGDAGDLTEGCITLTKDSYGNDPTQSRGRALYSERLYLWDPTSRNLTDFTTNFSFVIDSRNCVLP
ncbi:hypothetical protein VitviT2T_003880 [Vitis vinifera]|uniref:Legume lectin domain-containing protein n=2 Tax=Vitis vinifera TaxID=29760 RepID=A0ABY9BNA7_VITVI|nr:putative bark agglutinin LECRPA3 [Vitis vinifera]RVW75782.1 putative bark agglutinin LECRPA3 [Vitis vinifera]WJZ84269.1 hypothetical protein VitviT2T_003880 [Vitis vinifera]